MVQTRITQLVSTNKVKTVRINKREQQTFWQKADTYLRFILRMCVSLFELLNQKFFPQWVKEQTSDKYYLNLIFENNVFEDLVS